jgi:hypothetical protein
MPISSLIQLIRWAPADRAVPSQRIHIAVPDKIPCGGVQREVCTQFRIITSVPSSPMCQKVGSAPLDGPRNSATLASGSEPGGSFPDTGTHHDGLVRSEEKWHDASCPKGFSSRYHRHGASRSCGKRSPGRFCAGN